MVLFVDQMGIVCTYWAAVFSRSFNSLRAIHSSVINNREPLIVR